MWVLDLWWKEVDLRRVLELGGVRSFDGEGAFVHVLTVKLSCTRQNLMQRVIMPTRLTVDCELSWPLAICTLLIHGRS